MKKNTYNMCIYYIYVCITESLAVQKKLTQQWKSTVLE